MASKTLKYRCREFQQEWSTYLGNVDYDSATKDLLSEVAGPHYKSKQTDRTSLAGRLWYSLMFHSTQSILHNLLPSQPKTCQP